MFNPEYNKINGSYIVDIMLLGESVATFESHSIEDAVKTYIEFEEDFFKFSFTNEIKQLRLENAKLILQLKEQANESLFNKIVNLNIKLQALYISTGFDRLKRQHLDEYKTQLISEIEELGGELDG